MSSKPIYEARVEQLPVSVYETNQAMGVAAARAAAEVLVRAVNEKGVANIILAAANSQLTFLAALCQDKSIPWDKVNAFHMDEYIGIDAMHPASFPLFLRRNLMDHVRVKAFYTLSGQAKHIEMMMGEYAQLLREYPADVCALGYGENGHLAFNDPPFADFGDPLSVKVVRLAEMSRRQQVGEGHFRTLNDVPTHAVTLTIPALLAAKHVLAIVPETRKANAVKRALTGPIDEECPGSILRRVPHAHLFLDHDSAGTTFPFSNG
jgi:glucosamine-6-phosphate deaminase